MLCFILGLRGVVNKMTKVYSTPEATGEKAWTYLSHYVHIEGEAMKGEMELYKVRVGKEVGYVNKEDIDIRKESALATEDVSLRVAPDMKSEVLSFIYQGDLLYVYDVVGEFFDVEYRGQRGFIKADTCDYEEPFYEGNNDGERAVSIVKSKLGCPYHLWCNATGPYIFDCSGLMLFAFNRLDICLNRTAAEQIYGLESIPIDQIDKFLPGDVITYHTSSSNPDAITHVGMYIGNHTFIHASTNGYRVRMDNLDEYIKKYRIAHVARYFTV